MPCNLALLDFYGAYLPGQFAGLGEALSLEAVRAALDIEQVPRDDWPDLTRRLLVLHGLVNQHRPKPKEK